MSRGVAQGSGGRPAVDLARAFLGARTATGRGVAQERLARRLLRCG